MKATRGIDFRNKRYAAALGSLLLATAMLITACGPTNSGTTNSGNGNSGATNSSNGNSNGGNSNGGNSNGGNSSSSGDSNGGGNSNGGNAGGNGDTTNSGTTNSGTQVDYMYPAQGFVEVFQLNVDDAGDVTGSVYDVYNCGNDQTGTAPAPIPVTGTAPTDSTLDLEIGDSGELQGQVVNQGLDLTNSSGSTMELQLITASNSLDDAVSQQPPVYSISGYTCSDLPATNEP